MPCIVAGFLAPTKPLSKPNNNPIQSKQMELIPFLSRYNPPSIYSLGREFLEQVFHRP